MGGFGNKQISKNDRLSYGAGRTIDYTHSLGHEGDRFVLSDIRSMAAANSHTVLITSPQSTFVHFRNDKIGVEAAPVRFELYEGVAVNPASLGIIQPTFNVNRNSTKVSSVLIYADPSITDPGSRGTRIEQELLAIEGTETTFEWVLKGGTNYLLVYINESGAKTQVSHTNVFHSTDTFVLDV